MLASLHIENIAVVEKTDITFSEGFNVLTGETGAGKSIIIDAISAIIGERTSHDLIRTGENSANVSAVFENIDGEAAAILAELGYDCEDGTVLLSRKISSDGKNAVRINGTPSTVAVLKKVGAALVNIHGQHDSQSLLNPARHIEFIDAVGDSEALLKRYKTSYNEYKSTLKALEELQASDSESSQRADYLRYVIDEIESAELEIGERDELIKQREVIRNSVDIAQKLSAAHEILSGSEYSDGIPNMFKASVNELRKAAKYLPHLAEICERLDGFGYETEEIISEIDRELSNTDFDPNLLESIEARLDYLFRLLKKYGQTEEDVLAHLADCQKELSKIDNSNELIIELASKCQGLKAQTQSLAEQLSVKRKTAAEQFEKAVCNELAFLDMPKVVFKVEINEQQLSLNGFDSVEFLISVNVGEQPKPLAKIASGGELSRIMLAIKTVLADKDSISTLIFDEIDTGISGSAARKVGIKLKQVAKTHQVLCVTHLAQIASLADSHYRIEKHSDADKTFTEVAELDYEQRIDEVARIMSTGVTTDAMRASAKELIDLIEDL